MATAANAEQPSDPMVDGDRPSRFERVAPAWLTPSVRVRGFIALMALAAGTIYVLAVRDLSALPTPFAIPWPLAALAFYVGETRVVEVHFLRERHAFSLSELPGIFGLFFLSPTDYLLALLVGAGIAVVADRTQSRVKSAFNLAQFGLVGVIALVIFHLIASNAAPPGPQEWLAAFLAGGATSAIEALLALRRRTAVPEAAADVELQRDGRDGQHQPGDPGRDGPLG
jgi:hypothetical protein